MRSPGRVSNLQNEQRDLVCRQTDKDDKRSPRGGGGGGARRACVCVCVCVCVYDQSVHLGRMQVGRKNQTPMGKTAPLAALGGGGEVHASIWTSFFSLAACRLIFLCVTDAATVLYGDQYHDFWKLKPYAGEKEGKMCHELYVRITADLVNSKHHILTVTKTANYAVAIISIKTLCWWKTYRHISFLHMCKIETLVWKT